MLTNVDNYITSDGVTLRFTAFRPETDALRPAVICLHGGAFQERYEEPCRTQAEWLAEAGYVALCPEYRLAPTARFPTPQEDLFGFVRQVRERAPELGVDPRFVGAFGFECGGCFASTLGLTPGPDRKPLVDAVVTVSGISDLTRPHEQHYRPMARAIEAYMGCRYESNEDLFEQASPLFRVHRAAAPFLILHGERDDVVPYEQSTALAAALYEADAPSHLRLLQDEDHEFSEDAWATIDRWIEAFLAMHLSDEPYELYR